MHYLEFEMHYLHFLMCYLGMKIHYLHFRKGGSEMLPKVKYVKVRPARRPLPSA